MPATADYSRLTLDDWVRHYTGSALQQAGGIISDTRIIYPWRDIPAAKIRVDTKYKSVLRDVEACAALTPAEKQAFRAEYDAWRRFFCDGPKVDCTEPVWHMLGSGGAMDEIEKWESDRLYQWQQKIQSRCALSAPVYRPKPLAESAREGGASEEKMLKYGAIALAAVAAVYLLGPAARSIGSK